MNVALGLRSACCMVKFRRHGARTGIVTCHGKLPVVHGGGTTRIGRLRISGRAARAEIGAKPGAQLTIGHRVGVNQGISLVAEVSITIGDYTRIGDHVAVYDSSYHPVEEGGEVRRAPVTIGHNVWIGRAAIILPGVTIGDHSVVAAGSVVTKDVPARTLVAGSPAKHVRSLTASDDWRRP